MWSLFLFVSVGFSVTLQGISFSSPLSLQLSTFLNSSLLSSPSQQIPFVQVNETWLCNAGQGVIVPNITNVTIWGIYVRHEDAILQCQRSVLCSNAVRLGASVVVDAPLVNQPIGVVAAESTLMPRASISLCTVPFFLVAYSGPSGDYSSSSVAFSTLANSLFDVANNVTMSLGPPAFWVNRWFDYCRPVGSYFQVWEWTSVALSAVGIIMCGLRLVFIFREVGFTLAVPVLSVSFAALAFFWQLLRDAVNPSNCYGLLPSWSSEVDGFLFTADVPPTITALLLVAFYQLEIIQAKRLQGPRLDRLKIPAGIVILLLFVLQITVSVVSQNGADGQGGAVITQAVIYLVCFIGLLAFYIYATVALIRKIRKSPALRLKKLSGPIILSVMVILGCLCAFAASGLALAAVTKEYALFVTLEVLSDLSTLFCCFGIAIVIKANPPKVSEESSSVVQIVRRATQALSRRLTQSPMAKPQQEAPKEVPWEETVVDL